jgi:hypothetical protein
MDGSSDRQRKDRIGENRITDSTENTEGAGIRSSAGVRKGDARSRSIKRGKESEVIGKAGACRRLMMELEENL